MTNACGDKSDNTQKQWLQTAAAQHDTIKNAGFPFKYNHKRHGTNQRKHCQRLRKHRRATRTCTYIGNDRELADSTENVVPNPCTQDTRKASVSKVCWCKGKQKANRHRYKETKRKDSVE